MAMAGWDTQSMIDGITGIMDLAAASGEELGRVSDITTDALSAFGYEAKDASEFADLLATAASSSNTNVGMMGETFKYAAPVAGALGYSAKDTAIAIGLMANAGIKASTAGTALRTGMTNLVKPTEQAQKAMDKYKISVTDDDGKMLSFRDLLAHLRDRLGGLDEKQQAAAASAIFGKNAMSGWLAVINASDDDVDNLTRAIDNSEGAARRMAETMQDNLQGKVDLFKSALEGLGIELYEYFSGPLSSIVEMATGFISGITDALTPQKTAIESFIDDIEAANKSIEQSIEHAKSTISNGETEAAKISVYKDELMGILDQVGQFNKIDLGEGKYQIIDATGKIVEEGFEPVKAAVGDTDAIIEQFGKKGMDASGIKSGSEQAAEYIGYIQDRAVTVEEKLDKFAENGLNTDGVFEGKEVIVQIFNEAGEAVNTFEQKIDDAGTVTLDTAEVEGGCSAIVTALDETTGRVEQFSANLGTTELTLNTATLHDSLAIVEQEVEQCYKITDEFTKAKIDAMVSELGGAIDGLADSWNKQTGELTASKDELEKWFDEAKQVAMYTALQDAINEMYTAWGDAAVNVAKANSALKQALDDYNEAAGTTFQTYEDWEANCEGMTGSYADLEAAIFDAKDAVDESNGVLSDAETELENNVGALSELKDVIGETGEATAGTTGTVDEAAQALDGLEGAEDGATESADALAQKEEELAEKVDKAREAFEEAGGKVEYFDQALAEIGNSEEFLVWAEEQTKAVESIISGYEKMIETVRTSMDNYVSILDTSGEEGSNAFDNIIDNIHKKTEELEVWVANMKKLGEMAGKELPQGFYDELVAAGPEKTFDAVQQMVDAADSQTEKFDELSDVWARKLALEADVEALASCTTAGKAYSEAVASGFIEAQPELDSTITETITSGINAASDAAEGFRESGEKAIESQSQGMESKSGDVEDAARTVAESAKAATDTAVEKFSFTGKSADVALARGMSEDSSIPVERSRKLIEEIKKTIDDTAKELKGSGEESMRNYADGISNMGRDATGAVREIINETTGMLRDAREDYRAAGEDSIGSYSDALWRGEGEAISAASSIGRESAHEVSNFKYDWDWAGYDYSTGLANGIYNGESQAINAAITVATNALIAAKNTLGVASPAKELIKVGQYWDEGLAIGMQSGKAVDAAKDSAKEALEAARDELSTRAAIDLTSQIDLAGNRQIQRIMDTDIQMADTASAMRGLSSAAAAISDLANSLTNPQAPNVTVMIGNREFKGYIVTTAMEGMASKTAGIRHSMGGVA